MHNNVSTIIPISIFSFADFTGKSIPITVVNNTTRNENFSNIEE